MKKATFAIKAGLTILLTHILSLTSIAGNEIYVPVYTSVNAISATVTVKAIELSWTAGTEKAVDYVEVERSFNNQKYSTIGLVMGAEPSENTEAQFRFKDAAKNVAGHKVAYYRHKIIYADGTAAYSPATVVRVNTK